MEGPSIDEPVIPERNFWLRDGELRLLWKLLAFSGVFFLSSLVMAMLLIFTDSISGIQLWLLVQLFGVGAATVFCMVLIERKPIREVGFQPGRAVVRHLSFGIPVASSMVALVLLVELTTGLARITLVQLDVTRGLNIVATGLLQFAIVAVAEETISRGYPFLALRHRYNARVAILFTSLVFSAMHLGNPGVSMFGLMNIFLAGIWLGSARTLSGNLWLPISLHFAWNFVLGTVLGYPVSGMVDASVFVTVSHGPEMVSGGSFGPEGGLLVTGSLIAGTVLLYIPKVRAFISPPSKQDSDLMKEEVIS